MDKVITKERLQTILTHQFGGFIRKGPHFSHQQLVDPIELLSVAKELPFSDNPTAARTFDYRDINDIDVPDEVRTTEMLNLMVAFNDSMLWSEQKRVAIAEAIVISTLRHVLPSMVPITRKEGDFIDLISRTRDKRQALNVTSEAIRDFTRVPVPLKKPYELTIKKTPRFMSVLSWIFAALIESKEASALAAGKVANRVALTMSEPEERQQVFCAACHSWLAACHSYAAECG